MKGIGQFHNCYKFWNVSLGDEEVDLQRAANEWAVSLFLLPVLVVLVP
jgi:hypothetical protein